jgi:GntR family transcriptional regulator
MACYSTGVLPFRVSFQPGYPIYEQVVYAAKKAILSGSIAPGARFPSVRALSQELKVNPSTAHKVISELVSERLLEVHSTLGTIVAERAKASSRDAARLLNPHIERLVVEALSLGVDMQDVIERLTSHWNRLQPAHSPVSAKP